MFALNMRQGAWLRRALGFPGRTVALGLAIALLIHAPALYAVLTLAMIAWALPAYVALREEIEDREKAHGLAERQARAIGAELRTAQLQIGHLQSELADARTMPRASQGEDPTYRRVGLHPQCPAFVLTAARRAYRVALHPDCHPQHRKAQAHERFVSVEATFAEIDRQRGAFHP
ncbi:hypothetical protein MKK70_13405 [Methylobacterium sp. E-041]|uniref:hypothetical protein n=1 Tax=Methylobacterium sp. E-041 TaxID=2836573 RepID=UPI001FBBA6AD|nr:hypothetical protein [Methylobacterium sp. E-041]MCJ2106361.1 hypothetical protein [Methylobacterium sp. E-041]